VVFIFLRKILIINFLRIKNELVQFLNFYLKKFLDTLVGFHIIIKIKIANFQTGFQVGQFSPK
jgi:hypothetical protein